MRWLAILLLLAGCTQDASGDPGTVHMRLNGSYTTFGGVVTTH